MNMSTTNTTENDKSFLMEDTPRTDVAGTDVNPRTEDVTHSHRGDTHTNFYHREGDMVWRLFYDNSTFDHDGRYRCVAYCRNDADGLTKYGASIFKKDDKCTFNKRRVRRELSHTARKRFEKRPVRLIINKVTDQTDLQKRLTKAVFRYGVGAERVDDNAEKPYIHGTM